MKNPTETCNETIPNGTPAKIHVPDPPIPELTQAAQRTFLELPSGMALRDWTKLGEQIFYVWDSSGWWLGDWLIYGQANFPGRYEIAISETSLSYQTLRNYAWIARQFPVERRRKNLSFQHHGEVTSLPVEEQEKWFDRCERFGWSRNELRRRIKAALATQQDPYDPPAPEAQIQMTVTSDRKILWEKAAARTDQDLASWMVAVLDASAGRVLEEQLDPPMPP